MPDIIQAYNPGSSGIANAFQNAAESIFGNQAQQEVYRQTARRKQAENDALQQLGGALSSGDANAALRYAPIAGLQGQSAGDYLRAAAAAHAKGPDDPAVDLAFRGAGGSFGATALGQARALAEQAATQRAISERQAQAEEFKATHGFVQVGTDPNTGQPIRGFVNAMDKTVQPYYLPNAPPQMNAAGMPQPSGDEILASMPPGRANLIKGMLEGREPFPGNFSLKSPQILSLIQDAARVDPGFDATKWKARSTIETQLANATPNSLGGQLNFGGTALDHLEKLANKSLAMNNWSALGLSSVAQAANAIANTQYGPQQARAAEVRGEALHYGQEISKYYGGGRSGEKERLAFLSTINPNLPPEVQAGAIRAELDLLPGRTEQLEGQIAQVTGSPEYARRLIQRAFPPERIENIRRTLSKLDPNGPEAKIYGAQAGVPAMARPPAQASIQNLRQHPETASDFDARYGAGASRQYLGTP